MAGLPEARGAEYAEVFHDVIQIHELVRKSREREERKTRVYNIANAH